MSDPLHVWVRDDGLWDWKLVADNGEEVCGSLQGYTEKNDCLEGFERVMEMILTMAKGTNETADLPVKKVKQKKVRKRKAKK